MAVGDEEQERTERAARNEVSFRQANEVLQTKRTELELDGPTPFLCECGEPACTELVLLTLEAYEHVRTHPNWFVVAAGHDAGDAERVETHDGYDIVAKAGVAGRIAEEEDPRR